MLHLNEQLKEYGLIPAGLYNRNTILLNTNPNKWLLFLEESWKIA